MESRIRPDEIPEKAPMQTPGGKGASAWEVCGFLAGFAGCGCVAAQVITEWRAATTSLSPVNTFGFLLIFAFWAGYGWRFGRRALWMTNGVGVLLQAALIAVSLTK